MDEAVAYISFFVVVLIVLWACLNGTEFWLWSDNIVCLFVIAFGMIAGGYRTKGLGLFFLQFCFH